MKPDTAHKLGAQSRIPSTIFSFFVVVALSFGADRANASNLALKTLDHAHTIISEVSKIFKTAQRTTNGQFPIPLAIIPEPSSAVLLLGSALPLLLRRRRRFAA